MQSPDFQVLLFAYSFDGAPVQVVDLIQGEQLPSEVLQALTKPRCPQTRLQRAVRVVLPEQAL